MGRSCGNHREETRGEYYALRGESFESVYKETISDSYELCDWAANNMHWDEVEAIAAQSSPPTSVDYVDGWINGEKEIIEK